MRLHDRLEGEDEQPAPAKPAEPSKVPLPSELRRLERRPFVNRETALAVLRERWAAAQLGEGSVVLIGGEPGMGKTRLAARLAGEAYKDGAMLLYGRTDEEAVRPYQPFAEALGHLFTHCPDLADKPALRAAWAELAGFVPGLERPGATGDDPPPAEGQRHRLFDAIGLVLRHAADTRPVVLALDDLHWADAPTLLMLREVSRLAPACRLLVIATWRDREVAESGRLRRLIGDLRREEVLHQISLSGLGAEETAALVAQRGGDDALAGELHELSGGNPFFIEELLRSRRESPDATDAVPESITQVIARRLERLSEDTVDVLVTAAVLGASFDLATLMAIAGDVDVVEGVEAAVRAGLVIEDPDRHDGFAFAHAVVRETLYQRPMAGRRVRIHLAVAEALEVAELEVPPAELARHYFVARQVGGAEPAVEYSMRAAEQCQTAHAYEEVAAHYEKALVALDIARPDDLETRADIMLALGRARWQASERGPRLAFEIAASLARELGSAERLARAALGAGGRYYAPGILDPSYVALLEEALAALEPDDSALRACLLARLAEQLAFTDPTGRAQSLARTAVAMARRLGEPAALSASLMSLHAALLHVEHAAERRRVAEEALALAGELYDDELAALGRHWLVYDLIELDELPEARRRRTQLEGLAEHLRQPLYRHSVLAWRCVWAGLAARWDEAERLADESLRLAERAGDPDARSHYDAQLLTLRREQGRLGELLSAIADHADDDSAVAVHWRAQLPLAHLDAGDEAAARAAFAAALGAGISAIPLTMPWLSTVASLAEAAALLGDREAAGRLYPALEPFADNLVQSGFAGCAGAVQRLLGRLAGTLGHVDAAVRHLDAALARHRMLGAPALTARTQCDLGELLAGQADPGERSRGEALLAEALVTARRLELRGIEARATGSGG